METANDKYGNEVLASTSTPTVIYECIFITSLILARYTCAIMDSTVKEAILRSRGGGKPALPVKGEGHPDSPRDLTKLCGESSLGITRKGTLHSSWAQTKSRQWSCYKDFTLSLLWNVFLMTALCLLSCRSRAFVTSTGWISKLQERLRRLKYCHASFQTHKLFYYSLNQNLKKLKRTGELVLLSFQK